MMRSARHLAYYRVPDLDSDIRSDGRIMNPVQRVILFFIMIAVVPTVLIVSSIYLRHNVYADVTFPVAESDVLAINEGISSVFCEGVGLNMSTSFNAFQLVGTPKISGKMKHIRLKKSMTLPDDTLEYWGFYLLKGAIVQLKVCSRYDGSRIMVVRGGKNLNTCGLMEHNYQNYGAKMDSEHNRVKVTYENPAEHLGLIDVDMDYDAAEEDLTDDDNIVKGKLELGSSKKNLMEFSNGTTYIHQKRHIKKRNQKIEELKEILDEYQRPKRSISALDAHIKHGGNAINFTTMDINVESDSVSSFETDLLSCYDGRILLTRGFLPSHFCNNIDYLNQSSHMVTEHLVASDGYYYYIFYSDNDFVKNDIHAVFDIYKPTYRLANSSSANECINQTECEFPLHFLSDETIIVEVPTRDGIEHEADDITLMTSTCKPRTAVYLIFPFLVLLSVFICGFVL